MKRTLLIQDHEVKVEYNYLPGDLYQPSEIEFVEIQTNPIVDSNDIAEQLYFQLTDQLLEMHEGKRDNYYE